MSNKSSFNMLKIIFLIFIVSSLQADMNKIVTSYRLNGIDNIEKQLDQELASQEYWNDYLKNKDTQFGFSEKYKSLLACDKDKSILSLYQKDAKGSFVLIKTYNAYVGKLKGDKESEGDLRTPIGIYNLTKKISKLDSFYGPLAFVTSYPNEYDKYKGKNGHGIWIHGLPTEQTRDDFTKGCIAINNDSLECLDRHIDLENTILIINQSKVQHHPSKDVLANLLAQLYKWRYAWIYNDLETYLNFYLPEFVRSDKMDYERFVKYKTRIFHKNESKEIIFKNLSVYPYPFYQNIYQITFKEFYKSNSFQFTGDKTLIVQLDQNNDMKIITEK